MIPLLSKFGRFRMSAAGQNPTLFQAMRRFDELLPDDYFQRKPENHEENQKRDTIIIAKVHCVGFMFVPGGVVARVYIYID